MKTERRHDLETNELARFTAEGIEKVKPYGAQVFGTALVVVGVLILLSLWGTASETKDAAAWTDYAQAFAAEDDDLLSLQQVALSDEHHGTVMQEWAHITWADRQTALASRQYLVDREDANERLNEAAAVYEELERGATSEAVLERARFGLGRIYEMQNRLDEARDKYDSVRGAYELIARSRSDNLAKPEVQEAFQWLASAELPKPKATGATGDKPKFDINLPNSDTSQKRSLEDILGFGNSGDSSDRYGEESEQSPAVLDEIFQDDGTNGTADPDSSDETQADADADAAPEADDSSEENAEAESAEQ